MTSITGVNKNLTDRRSKDVHDPQCLSCNAEVKMCHHMLHCKEEERAQTMGATIELLDRWMKLVGTHPLLRPLREYTGWRGGVIMSSIVWGKGLHF
jgi:hypothetical protein